MSESIQKLVIVSSAQTRCDNINGQNGCDSHENVVKFIGCVTVGGNQLLL